MRATSASGGQGAILCGAEKVSRLLKRHHLSSGRVRHSVRRREVEEEGARGDRGQEARLLRGADERWGEQDRRDERDQARFPDTREEEEGQAEEDQESGRPTAPRPREIRRERRGDKEAAGTAEKDSSTAEAAGAGDEGKGAAAAAPTAAPGDGPPGGRLRERGAQLFLTAKDVRAHGPVPPTDQRFRILRAKLDRQPLQHKRETEPGAPTALQPKSKVHVALVHSFRPILGDKHGHFLGEQLGTVAVDVPERGASGLRAPHEYIPAEHEQRPSPVQPSRESGEPPRQPRDPVSPELHELHGLSRADVRASQSPSPSNDADTVEPDHRRTLAPLPPHTPPHAPPHADPRLHVAAPPPARAVRGHEEERGGTGRCLEKFERSRISSRSDTEHSRRW